MVTADNVTRYSYLKIKVSTLKYVRIHIYSRLGLLVFFIYHNVINYSFGHSPYSIPRCFTPVCSWGGGGWALTENQCPCPLHPYELKVKYKSSSHKWYINGDKLCLSFYLEYDHRADGIFVA